MSNYNRVIVMGNLTRDPELRYLPNGTAVAKIGMAVNRTYKLESGEKKEEVTFLDIEAWRQSAENIAKYCKKGSAILCEGRLKQEVWVDKQTQEKRSRLIIVCDNFQFVGGKASSDAPAPAPEQPKADAPTDDEIPY
jgi:single-strand DNA-binding protein